MRPPKGAMLPMLVAGGGVFSFPRECVCWCFLAVVWEDEGAEGFSVCGAGVCVTWRVRVCWSPQVTAGDPLRVCWSPQVTLDESQPLTTIQIRLHDGTYPLPPSFPPSIPPLACNL
eukprot:1900902-Rhodomonas_salina.1